MKKIINFLGEFLAGASVFIIPIALLFIGDRLGLNDNDKKTYREEPKSEIIIDWKNLNGR